MLARFDFKQSRPTDHLGRSLNRLNHVIVLALEVIIKQDFDWSLTINHGSQKSWHPPTAINEHKIRVDLLCPQHVPRPPGSHQKLSATVMGEIGLSEIWIAPLLGGANIAMEGMKTLRQPFFR